MMPKIKVNCSWCGKELFKWPCRIKSNKHFYCCKECRIKYISKVTNPEGYIRHPHLSKWNIDTNSGSMDLSRRMAMREAKLKKEKTRKKTTYEKYLGKHKHRIVAEIMLGRKLTPSEVVHHIDGDKSNNSPKNLKVFKNQSEHLKEHLRSDKKYKR
jgi:HNH endonuclease